MLKNSLSLLLAFTFGAGALAQSYTVKAGDTLYSVARAHSVSAAQLAKLNYFPANITLNVGQTLNLATPMQNKAAPSSTGGGSSYTVKVGDTLYGVAKARGLNLYQFAALNNLAANATLEVGQNLKLLGNLLAQNNVQVSAPAQAQTVKAPVVKVAAPQVSALSRTTARSNSYGRVRAVSTRYVGIRYAHGGTGRYGLDCSGFTSSVFRDLGISLPRTARGQYNTGRYVTRSSLREGDLVFFNTLGGGVSHVGVYLGGGMMANANSYHGRVMVESMNTSYWSPRFVGARRVMG